MDATAVISKKANIAMNAYGRRGNVRRKRTKQLVVILLSITMITLATAKPYQEVKATGMGAIAGGAAAGGLASFGTSILIGGLIVGGIIVASGVTSQDVKDLYASGKKHEVEKAVDKAASKMKEDFYNHTVQALNNNVSAAEQQRDNAAHARTTIDDFLETLAGGVIDTTSEAYRWFQDFCDDIRGAIGGDTSDMNGIAGYDLSGVYTKAVELKPKRDDASYSSLSIEFKGLNTLGITSNMCVLAIANSGTAASLVVGEILPNGKIRKLSNSLVKSIGAQYRIIYDTFTGPWIDYTGSYTYSLANSDFFDPVFNLPLIDATYAAPSGTTDVPGVSNVNDYVAVGSDLPYKRPEGAWDICDPNGKAGQVSIGADLPQRLGYDDWYDLLGGINAGQSTWEEVADASDVIRIGSDSPGVYDPSDSDAASWGACVDGAIVAGYDVDENGNITITYVDGHTITIPSEYADSITWTDTDGTTELDKDTSISFPAAGTISIPLPGYLDTDIPADPDPGESGGGDIKVDTDASDYTLDFRKLFPFCIPFDIYKAVKLLDASPTAPVVHYKFYFSKSKTYTIDLNLNKFNSVAAILRRMECLLFIIGLATATRRIYIRG